jgi:hypothetical protein
MKQLVENPGLGRAKGSKARERLIANFSYLAIGQAYAERVQSLLLQRQPAMA